MRTLRLVLATLATLLGAVTVTTPASAATPDTGHYAGSDGVGLQVGTTPHGTPRIDSAHYHHLGAFPQVLVHEDGSFRTCMRHGHTVFKEYCIVGQFGTAHHAAGRVEIYRGAMGHVEQRPYETHHFAVARPA